MCNDQKDPVVVGGCQPMEDTGLLRRGCATTSSGRRAGLEGRRSGMAGGWSRETLLAEWAQHHPPPAPASSFSAAAFDPHPVHCGLRWVKAGGAPAGGAVLAAARVALIVRR